MKLERSVSDAFLAHVESCRRAFDSVRTGDKGTFCRPQDAREEALRVALKEWPTLTPRWVDLLENYDSDTFGPLLGVSDEGSACKVIAEAAQCSAKARALGGADPMSLGVIIDGERMTSAGEVPIGPDEYSQVIEAAFARTHCTTNVGVRANVRLFQPLPEFHVSEALSNRDAWIAAIFSRFQPFLRTPSGHPRPLTVRLVVRPDTDFDLVGTLVSEIERGRNSGRLGSHELHRLSLLLEFDREIGAKDASKVKEVLKLAAQVKIPEVALDGELIEAARRRLSAQGLLNVLSVEMARELLAEALRYKVRLTHRYALDVESAARTIWTGLHTARTYGLNGAKFGLVPLTLDEQVGVVGKVMRWTEGWTAVPAFYVDTPLVTQEDVFDEERCEAAARQWMEKVCEAGAKVVLIDCPDRIAPRRLIHKEETNDRGVLTLPQIRSLHHHACELGLRVLWSGGITSDQVFELAKMGAFGIFTTSSTAQQIAVGEVLQSDPQLATENEPTKLGVRRIHALVQGGFLTTVLAPTQAQLASEIEMASLKLLAAIAQASEVEGALSQLNEALVRGWKVHWEKS